MVVRFLATKVLPAVAVTSAAITIYSSSAHAFFPPVPIGSDVVVTPPTSPISPLPPPVSPPPIPPLPPPVSPPPIPPLPVSPPPVDPGCHPNQVPEPATMVTGLIGLSVLGAGALRKKFGKKADGGGSAKS